MNFVITNRSNNTVTAVTDNERYTVCVNISDLTKRYTNQRDLDKKIYERVRQTLSLLAIAPIRK